MVLSGPERVVVLVRDGCHLCAEALGVIEGVCARVGATWRSVDIDSDSALRADYTDHVPVTFVDGVLHARWFVDATDLEQALTRNA
ncbi:MAG: glutaredoxin family protein [Propionicimonas sp.]|uniref:glutaredoxin family protein n=1 Tax=Propionicimonas sp. TaxID=1955623 RepID=UPI002B202C72|nr:glutaredoxin family protein [Propionicimonas sp.]MEA4944922.1 glutaredoxin family protein [Propionicimonas sp.]MEA5055580.1 glutaredoxin family protein [Propionicimonas sp.]